MGDGNRRTATKGRKRRTTSVSVGGIVKTSEGKYAVTLRVGGQTLLVPAGGGERPDITKIRNRVRSLGSKISATMTPGPDGKLKINLKGSGDKGISFSAVKP